MATNAELTNINTTCIWFKSKIQAQSYELLAFLLFFYAKVKLLSIEIMTKNI